MESINYNIIPLGDWFKVFRLFSKAAEHCDLYDYYDPVCAAKSIRRMIINHLIIEITIGDEVQGYLAMGVTQDWWTDKKTIIEIFTLGVLPGFGRLSVKCLMSAARHNGCSLITAGNVLAHDRKVIENLYIRSGYKAYQTFYKGVSYGTL